MKLIYFIFLIFLTSQYASAVECQFTVDSYKEASLSSSFLKFEMKSTKLGLITTGFDGFVKRYKVQVEVVGNHLKGSSVSFLANDLDTDIDARNEKMWTQCFDSQKYPSVELKLGEDLVLDGELRNVTASITLRGETFPVDLYIKAKRSNDLITVEVSGEASLKGLKIPDPSIMVAKVSDTILISGSVIMNVSNTCQIVTKLEVNK